MDAGVFGAMIPVVAIISFTVIRLSRGPIGDAFAHRLSGGSVDRALQEAVAELQEQAASLRAELAEVHERLDFTERLLAQPQASPPDSPARVVR